MTDKLEKKLRDVEDEHAGEVLDARIEAHNEEEKMRAMFVLGGIHVANRVSTALGSEAIKAAILFQDREMYRPFGYLRMVDFLNESEFAPMTKTQFYARKELLEKEGEYVFDMLTELGVSIRKRKLLGKGSVILEGDTVIVKSGDEETHIAITDRTRLLETLTALADANADKTKKLDKQEAAIAKHDDEKRELYNEIDRVKASKAAEVNDDPHSIAVVNLTFAYHALRDTYGDMSEIEREQFAPHDFGLIARLMTEVAAAAGRSDWTKIAGTRTPASAADEAGGDIDAVLNAALDADDDNDAALAAKL